jgi:glycyl-tRNA synthetase beta chain
VRHFDDYEKKLRDAHVILDAAERKEIILHDAKQKAFALGLELIEDEGLLEEVAGLAEWPVVLIGKIEDQFMDVPGEILQTSMRTHQKYFALRDTKTGKLANRFAVVSNMVTADGGKEIVAGNERVLRARLSDAKFFWDQDRKRTLESRVDDLKNIVFHAKLGTQYERVKRIEWLAVEIAERIGADPSKARQAARLCKADLTAGVVGEFPELQGVMGRYYALHDGENLEIANAIRDHYKPVGPTDETPVSPVSNAVALADKFDILLGFFLVGEKPSGSRDPFALRRAALGVIRIILTTNLRIALSDLWWKPLVHISVDLMLSEEAAALSKTEEGLGRLGLIGEIGRLREAAESYSESDAVLNEYDDKHIVASNELLSFLADRLKVALREKGTRHDLIDAVFSLGNEDDLVRLVARVEALQAFLKTDDGANLLVGYKRAANILKAEEKKEGKPFGTLPFIAANAPPEERDLANALESAQVQIRELVPLEKFTEAMKVMAGLRKFVDAFFDKVKVNDDNKDVRANRLMLLSRLRETLHTVADFSKIEG